MKKIVSILILSIFLTSCVMGMSDAERREYAMYKSKGHNIETKNKYIGGGLGILPGGGSFYTGHVGYGLVDIVFWPVSILWEVFNGYNGSEKINYENTKELVLRKKETEMRQLTMEFEVGKISQKEYIVSKQKVEDKYSSSF